MIKMRSRSKCHSDQRGKIGKKSAQKLSVICAPKIKTRRIEEIFNLAGLEVVKNGPFFTMTVPVLDGVNVSHLLWADDLVLLALDTRSLQHMLHLLHEYCI